MKQTIINGDCLTELNKIPDNSIDCVVTSPPYNLEGLRGHPSQRHKKKGFGRNKKTDRFDWNYEFADLGYEGDNLPEQQYQQWQIDVLNECHRVIKPTGSIFYNHKVRRKGGAACHPWDFVGKSKAKFYQEIVWDRCGAHNTNARFLMPTTERVYWLVKDKPQVFRAQATIREEIWRIAPIRHNKRPDHPAPMPPQIATNCILLTTQPGDVVLDPFAGSFTTGVAAKELGRNFIGIEISQKYCDLGRERLK